MNKALLLLTLLVGCIDYTGDSDTPEISNLRCTPTTLVASTTTTIQCSADFNGAASEAHVVVVDLNGIEIQTTDEHPAIDHDADVGTLAFRLASMPSVGELHFSFWLYDIGHGNDSNRLATTIDVVGP